MYRSLKCRLPKATCFWRHLYSSLMCFFSTPCCKITSVQWVGKYHSTIPGDHVGVLSLHFRLLWANRFTQQVSTSLHLSLLTGAVSPNRRLPTSSTLSSTRVSTAWLWVTVVTSTLTDCRCCTLWRPYWSNWDLYKSFIQNPDHYWSQMPHCSCYTIRGSTHLWGQVMAKSLMRCDNYEL